jgi:hypothetical protein
MRPGRKSEFLPSGHPEGFFVGGVGIYGAATFWGVISSKRQRVEKSTHLWDIGGQIDAKIPRFRFASLGMTAFMVIGNYPINWDLERSRWLLNGK